MSAKLPARRDQTCEKASRRLDQWLWFARFTKSRSLAARFCAAGAISINGIAVAKANHGVKIGDLVTVQQGPRQRSVEVLSLGARRGPASEAQTLFRETERLRRVDLAPAWEPLLVAEED